MLNRESLYQSYLAILREEMIPALGCTEPIAIAYGAARAREILGADPDRIVIGVCPSIFKNAKSVIVPNTQHLKGVAASVAAGVAAGDASKELEVLSEITEPQLESIRHLLDTCPIEVTIPEDSLNFDIRITLYKGDHTAYVRIALFHTNIVCETKDNRILKNVSLAEEVADVSNTNDTENADSKENPADEAGHDQLVISTDRSLLTMRNIVDFADHADIEQVRSLLDRQISFNMAIAEEGLKTAPGAAIGATLLKYDGDSIKNKAKAYAAAGSDARMDGCEMPVIINSGSGNQGITCSVPVIVYARHLGVNDEKLYRALLISNLTCIHIKTPIGRLSAYCGAVSAGAAAGAGIAYLHGGGYEEVVHTVVNALANVSGIICDGAKSSCAAKIASAVDAGIFGYQMYLNGKEFFGGDGIVAGGVEPTLKNIGRLGCDGMKGTNEEIVRMMLEC
ncbi:MAG: serine dehydratase subunit alpha family protein [Lachnospiraceae bacterium]|nr:serine dehydratase subunit alpha family protein [Candidatus Equihabitans merdae]